MPKRMHRCSPLAVPAGREPANARLAASVAGSGQAGLSCKPVTAKCARLRVDATAMERGVTPPSRPDGRPQSDWDSFWQVVRIFEATASRPAPKMFSELGLRVQGPQAAIPPRTVLQAMADAKSRGVDIGPLLDGAVESRFMSKIVPSSAMTYASHLRMIAWASELLEVVPLGCSVAHIRRVIAVCFNSSTQRGWLSAWAMAHQLAGMPWQGDGDVILKGIRTGTYKSRAPRMPRNKINRPVVLKLLREAGKRRRFWWSAILALAYSFLLRMPSELFRQFDIKLLAADGGKFTYGPIRRKQRQDWCFITSFCCCEHSELLCMHTWLPVLTELTREPGSKRLGGYNPSSWTAELRQLLQAVGVADPQAWFGHDVRRGAAADVFAASGVDAMLARGGWRSLPAARPYVPSDEIAGGLLAQGVIDDSSPEN